MTPEGPIANAPRPKSVPDADLARARRRGFTVIALILCGAVACGAYAAWALADRGLPIGGLYDRVTDSRDSYPEEISTALTDEERELTAVFGDQSDEADKVLSRQPALKARLESHAISEIERLGGVTSAERLGPTQRLGSTHSTLLGVGMPGVDDATADAYVLVSQDLEVKAPKDGWRVYSVDRQVLRVPLVGSLGSLKPITATTGEDTVDGAMFPERALWPQWVMDEFDGTVSAEGEESPESGSEAIGSCEEYTPGETRATDDVLAEQPGLRAGLRSATLRHLKNEDFKFNDVPKPGTRFRQRYELLGISREGTRVDAYVVVVRDIVGSDDPFYDRDLAAFRIQLRGRSGDYRVASITQSNEMIGETASDDLDRWPMWAMSALDEARY